MMGTAFGALAGAQNRHKELYEQGLKDFDKLYAEFMSIPVSRKKEKRMAAMTLVWLHGYILAHYNEAAPHTEFVQYLPNGRNQSEYENVRNWMLYEA